ncbi:GM11646 [Drosophila sechellia]|uniref:GM11646 n=1 Tax=Drosophila sechellia TaxID=7238 RepID=B4ILX6_DROSE|nr:GM11646 [Drosophila sechellia]
MTKLDKVSNATNCKSQSALRIYPECGTLCYMVSDCPKSRRANLNCGDCDEVAALGDKLQAPCPVPQAATV